MAKKEKPYDPHDSSALHQSYGEPIPQPTMIKGDFVAFGESAGTTSKAMSLEPKRNICFKDSIEDNKKNQPRSH